MSPCRFNRTFMELKHFISCRLLLHVKSFNRTFMELKHSIYPVNLDVYEF